MEMHSNLQSKVVLLFLLHQLFIGINSTSSTYIQQNSRAGLEQQLSVERIQSTNSTVNMNGHIFPSLCGVLRDLHHGFSIINLLSFTGLFLYEAFICKARLYTGLLKNIVDTFAQQFYFFKRFYNHISPTGTTKHI